MKLELRFLAITLAAIVLAVPVASAMQHRNYQQQVHKLQSSNLQFKAEPKQKQAKAKDQHIQIERKKNTDLKKKLESKRKVKLKVAARQTLVSSSGNCSAYRKLVAQYSWNVSVAMAVMQAESGCRVVTPDNSALNYDHVADHGLFQLHGINVTDPAENIRIAYKVKYLSQGWGAWSTYNNGAYLRYLGT